MMKNKLPPRILFLSMSCFLLLMQTSSFGQPAIWTNANTGASAGNWSVASNWNPAAVPTSANSAQISNGGEARVTSNIVASRIEVGKNGGVGLFTSVSSGVEIIIDSDFDIGEIGGDFATGPVTVTSDGAVSISNAAHLLIGDSGSGDLDLGQTNATAGAQASGLGSLTLNNVALVEVIDDADVGQAGGSATASADGTLMVTSVADFQIGADFDIGQSGGTGQSMAVGLATILNSQIIIGADADVGRTTGSSGGNSGDGTLNATASTISVGFANTLTPGSLNIGDSGTLGSQRATGIGVVSLEQTALDVADKINIGGLSGGGTNALSSANGSLSLVDSSAKAADMNVAVIATGTAGTAAGLLALDASLLTIDGVLDLGSGATLSFELAGTTKADGTGGSGQYGAIDVLSASLDGSLEVALSDGFVPAAGDQFDLISSTGIISDAFVATSLPSLSGGLSWNLLQSTNLLRLEVLGSALDGDFNADGDIDGTDFLVWQRGYGALSGANKTQGDADLDGDVDQADLGIWESTYGTTSTLQSLGTLAVVPEPVTLTLVILSVSLFPYRVTRSARRLAGGGSR